jgi:3-hydroxyisobutyrate dehydrogenase
VVVNAAQTEGVLFGELGAAAAMKPGHLFVMCSTVDPNVSIGLEQRLAERGVLYLDAPISGGAAKAASAQMTMMTAGRPEAYAKAGRALESMAAQVYKLGDKAGNGSKVKIINQLLAGVNIAAAAEAMALGLREGVDPAALYEVITHSAGNSWMFENRMPHILAADYTPLSAVDIFVKDLGLVLDTARATKFPLPLASTAHQMFMQASSAGHGREDDAAVIKIFPGITLPQKKG